MTNRRAKLIDMKTENNGLTRFTYYISSRNFLGFRNEVFLEQALGFINDDELLEITPLNIRLRKKNLSKIARVKEQRAFRK